MRIRNIFTTIIISYLLIMIISGAVDGVFLQEKARQVNYVIKTASDMALEQAQVTDDFFKAGEGFYIAGALGAEHNPYTFMTFDADNETINYNDNIYQRYTGKTEKGEIYDYLFSANGSNFKDYINKVTPAKLEKLTTQYYIYNGATSTMQKLEAPTLMQMGVEVNSTPRVEGAKTDTDIGITGSLSGIIGNTGDGFALKNSTNAEGYEINSVSKLSYNHDTGEYENYFLTPLALGVTYLDPDLLQRLYINNVNLLMRAAYIEEVTHPTGYVGRVEGGKGVLRGETYSQDLKIDPTLDRQAINNGQITAIIGDYDLATNMFQGPINREAVVEYKVIDMYNNSNAEILKEVLGVIPKSEFNKQGVAVGNYGGYYRKIDTLNIGTTGVQKTSKPMVVAKVTFKLDVIIPYSTPSMRELRMYNPEGEEGVKARKLFEYDASHITPNNFIDLRPREITASYTSLDNITVGIPKDGVREVEYTTFFAVTP